MDFIRDEYPEYIPESVMQDYRGGVEMYSVTKDYAYRLSKKNGEKNGIIERILIEEWNYAGSRGFHIPREKPP